MPSSIRQPVWSPRRPARPEASTPYPRPTPNLSALQVVLTYPTTSPCCIRLMDLHGASGGQGGGWPLVGSVQTAWRGAGRRRRTLFKLLTREGGPPLFGRWTRAAMPACRAGPATGGRRAVPSPYVAAAWWPPPGNLPGPPAARRSRQADRSWTDRPTVAMARRRASGKIAEGQSRLSTPPTWTATARPKAGASRLPAGDRDGEVAPLNLRHRPEPC